MNIFRIEAEQLKKAPVRLTFSEPAALFGITDEDLYRFHDPVSGEILATAAGTTVVLQGEIRTVVTTSCVRCLEPVRINVAARVDLSYMHEPRLLGLAHRDEDDDADTESYDGEIITPAAQLRELLLLELPAFPHCEGAGKKRCQATLAEWRHVNDPGDEDEAAGEARVANPWRDQLARVRSELKQNRRS